MIITTALKSMAPASSPLAQLVPNKLLKAIHHPRYCVAAVISTAGQKRFFYADAGLGANNMKADRHFVKHKLSTDTQSAVRSMFKFPVEGAEARIEAYKDAFKKVHGRAPQNHEIMDSRPWQVLKFADRHLLEKADVPYVAYYRQAVNTSLERGGKVHFFVGGIDANEYITSIVKTELREQKPFAEFAGSVDFNTLANVGKGDAFSLYTGPIAQEMPAVEQPKITTVELFDATKGEFKEAGRDFHYYANNETLLDTKQLLALQDQVLTAASSKENRALLRDGKQMTAEAQRLVGKLQLYFDQGRLN